MSHVLSSFQAMTLTQLHRWMIFSLLEGTSSLLSLLSLTFKAADQYRSIRMDTRTINIPTVKLQSLL